LPFFFAAFGCSEVGVSVGKSEDELPRDAARRTDVSARVFALGEELPRAGDESP
jgi:hypothetical protein